MGFPTHDPSVEIIIYQSWVKIQSAVWCGLVLLTGGETELLNRLTESWATSWRSVPKWEKQANSLIYKYITAKSLFLKDLAKIAR